MDGCIETERRREGWFKGSWDQPKVMRPVPGLSKGGLDDSTYSLRPMGSNRSPQGHPLLGQSGQLTH